MPRKSQETSSTSDLPDLTTAERVVAILVALRANLGGRLLEWDQIEGLQIGLNRAEATDYLNDRELEPEQEALYEYLFEHFPELADLPIELPPAIVDDADADEVDKGELVGGAPPITIPTYMAPEFDENVSREAQDTNSARPEGVKVVLGQDSFGSPFWDEMVQSRIRIEPLRIPAFELPDSNPVLNDVSALLSLLAFEAIAHARQQLAELLGALAERFGASTAAIFNLEENGQLNAFLRHNVRKPQLTAHINDECGIVPYVAREQNGYCAADTSQDARYREDVRETRSEIAVPIIHPLDLEGDKRVLGVVNLESCEINAFASAQISEIQASVGAFVPHLLVLSSLSNRNEAWLPWHPEIHGWDLTRIFQKMCHTVAGSLGADSTKCSIWYVDQPKQSLFVYATNGYDIEYKNDRLLPIDSRTGILSGKSRGAVYLSDPQQQFVRSEKARRMGLRTALHCPIYPPASKSRQRGISVLNLYFTDDVHDRTLVREAMIKLADIIGALTASFATQRRQIATAQLHHLLEEMPRSSESDFEVIRDFFKDVFAADGVSIFGRRTKNRHLECTATTGLCRGDDRDCTVDPRKVRYKLDAQDDSAGYTISVGLNPGTPLRMNNVLNRSEADLPEFLRQQPMLKWVENFAPREDKNRRMLAYGIASDPHCESKSGKRIPSMGVVRILRRSGSKPFTQCDEHLIADLTNVCRSAFQNWRRVGAPLRPQPVKLSRSRSQSQEVVRAYSRMLRTIPIGRSTRTLIHELVQDLFVCYHGWNLNWSAVFVRHGAPPAEHFRLHTYYSEPDSTPALELSSMPQDDPYLLHRREFAASKSAGQFGTPFGLACHTTIADGKIASGVRVPVVAWSKQGLIEAVLALDFKNGCDWNKLEFDPLLYGASRLAAIWSSNNISDEPIRFADAHHSFMNFEQTAIRLQQYLQNRFEVSVDVHWSPPLPFSGWQVIAAEEDREASIYGLKRHQAKNLLAIPLRIGPIPAACLTLSADAFATTSQMHPLLDAVTGIWSQLTFGSANSVCRQQMWNASFAHKNLNPLTTVFSCDLSWNASAN
jgi:putative methionine-R-sulfoxide reductase with GAF domain